MQVLGERGLVLGASMSGLMAARVLSDAYEQVTVVERDLLPRHSDPRKGVPQCRHPHALLSRGAEIVDELFPGLLADLVASGVPVIRDLSEARFSVGGHLTCRDQHRTALATYQPSRPHLERHIRDRVRALPNVEFVEECDVVGLTTSGDADGITGSNRVTGSDRISRSDRVTGARIVRRGGGHPEVTLAADLVVDATGRGGRTTTWLPMMGYEPPAEDQLTVDIKYVTQHLRLAAGAPAIDRLIVIGAVPGRPSGLFMFEYENGGWALTLIGYGGHHPPTDLEGRLSFVRPLVPDHVFAAIRDAEPVGEVLTHRFPANLRRRYERLDRFPAGLVVLGDAVCSFNPLYGQGMSVAALQVLALRDTLAAGDHDLARRFFRAAAKPIDAAWRTAIAGDLTLPEVDGARPPGVRLTNAYASLILTATERDSVLAERVFRVNAFVDPPAMLFHPAVLRRVVAGNLRRRRSSGSSTARAK
jgi:2-polyprenyl-6-methoxyphenol hydroxylase-like FAD-dependent oxidoreductase